MRVAVIDSSDVAARKERWQDMMETRSIRKQGAAVNGDSLPLSILLGPANEHDTGKLIPVMKDARIRTGARPSRPEAYAYKACDPFFARTYLLSIN